MKYLILLLLVVAIVSCNRPSCPSKRFIGYGLNKPVYVPYFKSGDTLDCGVVRDAEGLNKAAALWEQGIWDASEKQIDSVFGVYCSSLK